MANNLFANVPAACVARQTISFASAGFDSSNTNIIYLVGSPIKSFVPGRPINGITGFVEGNGYWIVPKQNMDKTAILCPPVPDCVDDGMFTLTIAVTGVPDPIVYTVNGEVWDNGQRAFPAGTVIEDVVLTIPGYTITPISVSDVLMDMDKTITFDAVAEDAGFDPIDSEWNSGSGGELSNASRTSNDLFLVDQGSGGYGFTSLKLAPGEVGKVKCRLSSFGLFLYPDSRPNENPIENSTPYAMLHSGNKIKCLSFPSSPGGTYAEFTGYPDGTPVLVEMELTADECIFYAGDSRTELHRIDRTSDTVRIAVDLAGSGTDGITELLQTGFTLV